MSPTRKPLRRILTHLPIPTVATSMNRTLTAPTPMAKGRSLKNPNKRPVQNYAPFRVFYLPLQQVLRLHTLAQNLLHSKPGLEHPHTETLLLNQASSIPADHH